MQIDTEKIAEGTELTEEQVQYVIQEIKDQDFLFSHRTDGNPAHFV